MTLGEKIKTLRKQANISQEDFSLKIGVSRQTVTKWENDLSLPDIENMKTIAKIFNTSIDELIDYERKSLGELVMEEDYSLDGIKKMGKARSREEQVVVNKFPKATAIYSLLRKKKWSWKQHLFWFIVEAAYSPEMDDIVENGINTFCLVEEKDLQYIVIMHKGKMKVIKLNGVFKDKKLIIDNFIYKKNYKIL